MCHLKKFKAIFYFLFIIVVSANPSIQFAQAETGNPVPAPKSANLFLLPDYNSYFNKDNLNVDILIDPQGQVVNAADILIKFPPGLLSINSVKYLNSFCELIPKEEIDNQAGTARIACGTPENNISTTTKVASITFNKLNSGWAKLDTTESRILAGDGLGTNILRSPEIHNIYLFK